MTSAFRLAPVLAVFLSVALVGDGWAQEKKDDPPMPKTGGSSRKRDDGPRIRLGDAPKSDEPRDDAPDRAVPEKSEAEQLVTELATWPSADAKQASIRLSAQPSVAYPLLERQLLEADQDWRMVCGCAATLGRIGDLRALELIEAKIQDRSLFQHSGDLLDAIARIDPVGAKARLMAHLLHPSSAVVTEARERLEKRVAAFDLESLREICEVGGSAARLHALELMVRADPAGARPDLARALRDKSPAVAYAAARALAADAGEEALELARAQARSPIDRAAAYGCLSLGLRMADGGASVLEPQDVRLLLGGRGLKHMEPLNRASAAVALADAGYYHEIAGLEDQLERAVVPALIDAWVNPEFWSDMKVLQPLVLRRLRRLTGQFGLRDPREWQAWWQQSREAFTARRVLVKVPSDAIATLVVTLEGPEAPGGETTVIAASGAGLGSPVPGELSLLLPPAEAEELARVLNESKLLLARDLPASASRASGPLTLTVRAGNRERRLGLEPDGSNGATGPLLEHVEELRERHRWQRYRTAAAALDRESFVLAMAGRFAADRTPEERHAALADLIVSALSEPAAAARGERWAADALTELAAIPDLGSVLRDEQVNDLLRQLGSREQLDEVSAGLIQALAAARRPEAHPLLLEFLDARPSIRTHEMLVSVFEAARDDDLAAGLGDAREAVRVAAVAALRPTSLSGGGAGAARGALEDESPAVRAEAVRALGRLRDESARDQLEEYARSAGPMRMAAIEALGLLGGKQSLPALMSGFADDSAAVRVAAIEALAATGEPEGLSAIVFAMGGDPSGLVREVARGAILGIGTRRAADELRKLAIDPAQPAGPRARALSSLATLRGREATEDLRRLVEDPSDEVADEAALALAEWREPAAVPRLLAMLREGRSATRAKQALESISLESFGQSDPQLLWELYAGWWELSAESGPRGWLAERLGYEGVESPALSAWAEGRAGREAAPALIRGLRTDSWYVRRACDLALRDLLGRTVGDQRPWTTAREADRMASDWERAWNEYLDQ